MELQNDGRSAAEIIERLGDPKGLAKAYVGDLVTKEGITGWHRILALCAYYSLAGLSGLVVIPTLVICAPVFILCGAVTPLLGAVKMIDGLLHLGIPYADHIMVAGIQNPVLVFIACVVTGVLLALAGFGCWKLLRYYIKAVGKTGRHLSA